MIEIRQAVSTDVETISHFNIALCRETERRELGEADVDCCGIRLYMERENDTARESYRRLGFSETGYVVFERLFSRIDKA